MRRNVLEPFDQALHDLDATMQGIVTVRNSQATGILETRTSNLSYIAKANAECACQIVAAPHGLPVE